MNVCMYMCVCACVHACMRVHVRACMCACVFTCSACCISIFMPPLSSPLPHLSLSPPSLFLPPSLSSQLITDTIHNQIIHGSDFTSIDGHMNLTNRIAAVHVVYNSVWEELHWFGQLTSLHPGLLPSLTREGGQGAAGDEDMVSEGMG